MINLAVFISGRGSNMKAIHDACSKGMLDAQIVCVVSDKSDADGLIYAQQMGIQTYVVKRKKGEDKKVFEQSILDALSNHEIDLICLAGFMRILSDWFVSKWEGRILNIHPSLLPKYKGLDTYARAINNGDNVSGCSVHIVTAELDDGPVIVQKKVPINDSDTPDDLAARILEQEHLAYPEAIQKIAKSLSSH